MTHQQLLDNRLEFITHHRDSSEKRPGLLLFHSKFDYFKTAFLLDKKAIDQVPDNFTLHVVDWSGIEHEFPNKFDWKYNESMTFMELSNPPSGISTNQELIIKKALTESEIEVFCQVQSKAFNSNNEEADEWYPVLLAGAKRSLKTGTHQFYIGYVDSAPVGVTLTYTNQDCIGIYSVATLADYRNMGISSSLMNAVINDGLNAGIDNFTLQVTTGSYAQRFYEKLGFKAAFNCDMYNKNKSVNE